MYVVRALSTAEQLVVFVEDPVKEGRSGEVGGKGKGKATEDDEEMQIIDHSVAQPPTAADAAGSAPTSSSSSTLPTPTPPTHSRWSHLTLGSTSSGSAVAPFDAFLQRVLLGGSAAANNPTAGAWVPRATAVSLEGWVFSVGGAPGTVGDWEIRVDAVNLKGGASSGASRGLVVEVSCPRTFPTRMYAPLTATSRRPVSPALQATYLAVPHLPPSSTFVSDFLLSLFPTQAVAAGEVELVSVPEASFVEAGLLPAAVADEGADDAAREWEWTDKHSCFAYVQAFRKEGLL